MDFESRFPEPGTGQGHEYYACLCALATSGSLGRKEQADLCAHLATCAECRELFLEYRELATSGMAALAGVSHQRLEPAPEFSADCARTQLMERIAAGEKTPLLRLVPSSSRLAFSWRAWLFPLGSRALPIAAGVAFVLLALGASYRLGENHGLRSAQRRVPAVLTTVPSAVFDTTALRQEMEAAQREIDLLQAELKRQFAALASYQSVRQQLEQDNQRQNSMIATLNSENGQTAAERDAANRRLQETQAALEATQQRLDTLREENSRQVFRTASLQTRIDELTARLKESGEGLEREENSLASDRDIRELMGARDLYIADVFDIDRDGKTQKAFGRVFYTGGKSLIFYAFDLEKQPSGREARAFQAWGRRGPGDKHPLNMGVLHLDNAASRRWVLRFDDPKLLAQLDAVYVTVEPRGGGQKPTGKQLLFASLHMPPNHP